MKTKLLVMLLAAVSLGGDQRAYYDTQAYRETVFDTKVYFIAGFLTGYQAALYAPGHVQSPLEKCFEKWTYGQEQAILDKYIADHPEKWDMHFSLLVRDAFNAACKAENRGE